MNQEKELSQRTQWELEERGIDPAARSLSRDRFDSLSPLAQGELMLAGFRLFDELPKRQFEKLTGIDKRDFLERGGRVA